MDPRELLAIQLQRGQATAHKGRQELSGFGEAALNPGRAFAPNVDALTGKQGGLPTWAWVALGATALYFVARAR
jgi:hypothetical protein